MTEKWVPPTIAGSASSRAGTACCFPVVDVTQPSAHFVRPWQTGASAACPHRCLSTGNVHAPGRGKPGAGLPGVRARDDHDTELSPDGFAA